VFEPVIPDAHRVGDGRHDGFTAPMLGKKLVSTT
jgi:hypothetical protein